MEAEFAYDVFLSHNKADKPQVRRLAKRLKKAGLQVWFDEWVIQAGDQILLAIERGLEASRSLVLCLSPNALGSEWVTMERTTVLFRDPTNANRRFIPVLLADCEIPDALRGYKYVDYRNGSHAAFVRLLAACRPQEQRETVPVTRRPASKSPSVPAKSERLLAALRPGAKEVQPPKRRPLFAVHPYTLLTSDVLIGRRKALELLTCVAEEAGGEAVRVICLTAIGGTGKSALAWKWINDRAMAETDDGFVWWSFYDSGADIDRFVTMCLAYMTDADDSAIASALPSYNERESCFFELLASHRFRIVLDGLERVLNGYCRLDAAFISDESADSRYDSAHSPDWMRKAADPRTTQFLRRIATASAAGMKSFILATTRLVPTEFELSPGKLRIGIHLHNLAGLEGAEALEFWNAFGCHGTAENLLEFFDRLHGHALTIKVLASSVVRNFVPAPGDFDEWYEACDEFRVSSLHLINVRHHIFSTALSHLADDARHVLEIISAHRVDLTGQQLRRLQGGATDLSSLLVDLESRGLVGWNREKNVVSLHPVVRGYVWELTSEENRHSILQKLIAAYEDSLAEDEQGESFEANRERLILFGLLVQVGRFDDAWVLYDKRLRDVLWYRLGLAHEQCVLLEGLFEKGLRGSLLSSPTAQVRAAHILSHSIYLLGEPSRALSSFQFAVSVAESHRVEGQSHLLQQYAAALLTTGHLFNSERAIRQSIGMGTKSKKDRAFDFRYYGTLLETRGQFDCALKSLTMMQEMFDTLSESEYRDARIWRVMARDYVAELLVRMKRPAVAEAALSESDAIGAPRYPRDQVRTRRIRGSIASILAPERAERCLNEALRLAAELRFVEEQIMSLRLLGRSERILGKFQYAEDHLEQARELCLRGGYRVFESEIELELAQLFSARGMHGAAVEHATRGFRLAWCDGPPFSVRDVVSDCHGMLVAHGAEVPMLEGFHMEQTDALPPLPPHLSEFDLAQSL
jgi:tetratricopeptide (TPR) repeat protein